MDHICYLDQEWFEKFELGDEIYLRVSGEWKHRIAWQVFEKDFVYLASKQLPRNVHYQGLVQKVEEIEAGDESDLIAGLPVCFVDRKKWTDQLVGLICIALIKRESFSLASSRWPLRANWESIGNIHTRRLGGENYENSKI